MNDYGSSPLENFNPFIKDQGPGFEEYCDTHPSNSDLWRLNEYYCDAQGNLELKYFHVNKNHEILTCENGRIIPKDISQNYCYEIEANETKPYVGVAYSGGGFVSGYHSMVSTCIDDNTMFKPYCGSDGYIAGEIVSCADNEICITQYENNKKKEVFVQKIFNRVVLIMFMIN